eukprot:g76962.t1
MTLKIHRDLPRVHGMMQKPAMSSLSLAAIFVICASASVPPNSSVMAQLQAWFMEQGGFIHPNLTLLTYDNHTFEFVAKHDIGEKEYVIVFPQHMLITPLVALSSLVEHISKVNAVSKVNISTRLLAETLDLDSQYDSLKGVSFGKHSCSNENFKAILALYLYLNLDDASHYFYPWFLSLPRGCLNIICDSTIEKDLSSNTIFDDSKLKLLNELQELQHMRKVYMKIATSLGLDSESFLEMVSLVEAIAVDHPQTHDNKPSLMDAYVLVPFLHTLPRTHATTIAQDTLPRTHATTIAQAGANNNTVNITSIQGKFHGLQVQLATWMKEGEKLNVDDLCKSVGCKYPSKSPLRYPSFSHPAPLTVSHRPAVPMPVVNYTAFREWFVDNGGYVHPNLTLEQYPNKNNMRGFFATGTIKKRDTLFSCPQHMIFHDYAALFSLVENMPDVRRKSNLPPEQLTVKTLMEALDIDGPNDNMEGYELGEYRSTGIEAMIALYWHVHEDNPNHFYYPWFVSLPQGCCSAYCWSVDKLLETFVPTQVNDILSVIKIYRRMAENLGLKDVDAFLIKCALLATRTWHNDDMYKARGMAPYVDMINHPPSDKQGYFVDWDTKDWHGMKMKYPFDDAQAGEQIYLDYGGHSNAEFLLIYGFTIDFNPDDTCEELQAYLLDEVIDQIKLPHNVTCEHRPNLRQEVEKLRAELYSTERAKKKKSWNSVFFPVVLSVGSVGTLAAVYLLAVIVMDF